MALHAVGWLSKSLGINIAGRSDGSANPSASTTSGDGGAIPSNRTQPPPADDNDYFGAAARPRPSAFEAYVSQMSNMVFGGDAIAQQRPPGAANPSGGGAKDLVEHCEVDEQGLPIARNWYYYDQALGRWNVAPDAPEPIQREFAERLRHEEAAQRNSGAQVLAPPPPPPPPPSGPGSPFGPPTGSGYARSPVTPQYAMPSYFQTTTPTTAADVTGLPRGSPLPLQQQQQQQPASLAFPVPPSAPRAFGAPPPPPGPLPAVFTPMSLPLPPNTA
jgi:hypothetical protein